MPGLLSQPSVDMRKATFLMTKPTHGPVLWRVLLISLGAWRSAVPLAQGVEAAGPVATLSIGVATLTIDHRGSLSLRRGARVLIRDTRVVVAAPGWRHSVSQSSLEPAAGYPKREGQTYVFAGQLVDERSKCVWTFEERITPQADEVRVRHTITPSIDTTIAEAALFVDLPVSTWSGQDLLLIPSTKGVFPAEPAKPRHFLSGGVLTAVLGAGSDSQLTFAFTSPARCTVQDGREFGGSSYQMYPRLSSGGKIQAGIPCRLEFVLKPDDPVTHKFGAIELGATGEPAIGAIRQSAESVRQFHKFEVDVEVAGTWENPFDPRQVTLDAEFAGPDGHTFAVPGFFFQDYQRAGAGERELYLRKGDPGWRVRFAPPTPGLYRYRLRLCNQGRVVISTDRRLVCTAAAAAHGYLRVSRENPHYLQFDDGEPFFAIGENIATLPAFGLRQGEELYESFADVGGNFVRWWWSYGLSDLESRVSSRPDEGLGRYKLQNAWCIDRLVEEAEKHGIYLMCCFETQQYLRRDKRWPQFTYNVANGGPVASPADYFTNGSAAEYFRRRLRYIVARWSYSTAVFSWQFWNEVSACNDYRTEPVAVWHRDMARYLRRIDPAEHVIHTNYGNFDGYPQVDGLPETEVVSTNIYSRRDMGQTAVWGARVMGQRYAKPFLITEYGVGHHGGWDREDPDGVILHNGIWGAVIGGSAGTAMPWGWNHWVDAMDLYKYWPPVRDVVAGIPFCKRTWVPVNVESFRFRDGQLPTHYTSVLVEGWPRNYGFTLFPSAPEVIEIDSSGELHNQGGLRAALPANAVHRFRVDLPVAGEFIVHVPELSRRDGPVLEVAVDGRTLLSRELAAGKTPAHEFWRYFPVPISAGRCDIEVRNAGSATFWTAYEFTRYRRRDGPDLDVLGLQTHDYILLWVRNPQFAWIFRREGRGLQRQPEGVLTLRDVAVGRYHAVWRRTTTNDVLREDTLTVVDGRLVLPTPAITYSAGVRIERVQ